MSVILRERVSSQVQRYLRDRIISGELREGARLIEEEIAAELSVSRTPVREALVLLQSRDLVRALKGGGYEVRNFRSELMDILDVRVALETHAVRKMAGGVTDDMIRELTVLCDAMEKLQPQATEQRAKLNQSFHQTIVAAAANPRLFRIVNDYQEYFSAAQKLFDSKYIERSEREHRAIVAALTDRDAERAADIMGGHIAGAGEFIMSQTNGD